MNTIVKCNIIINIMMPDIIEFNCSRSRSGDTIVCFIKSVPTPMLKLNCDYYEQVPEFYEDIINYIINNKIGTYDYTIFETKENRLKYDIIYFNIINTEILLKLL